MDKNQFAYGNDVFTLLRERRTGARLYTNVDRSRYLRIGDRNLAEKELNFHHQLSDLGFPVAKILEEGELEGLHFWIEESLGQEHFSEIFRKDFESLGCISEPSFRAFVNIINTVRDAQERSIKVEPYNFSTLATAVGFDGMLNELPGSRDKMQKAWEQAKKELIGYPQCLTHGDLTSHNIVPGGVIDFGDHFNGPAGFDIVNAITTTFWFPKDKTYEYYKLYSFSDEQIEKYFSVVGQYQTPDGPIDITKKFDVLFFLRGTWWAVRNHKSPKLQAWRYEKYLAVVDEYINHGSLMYFWLAHKDD